MAELNATLKVTTEPASEPITLTNLKDSLRVTTTDFDTELTRILTAARRKVEYDTRRALITQTRKLYLDHWPSGSEIELRVAPVSAVSAFQYIDSDGSTQAVSTSVYQTDLNREPPRVMLKESQTWPTDIADEAPGAVILTLTCGYGANASDVPEEAIQAIVQAAKSMWTGCEEMLGVGSSYQRLVDFLSWTAYGRVLR